VSDAAEEAVDDVLPDNVVRESVDEFVRLNREMNERRQTLRAHGVPLRTSAMMVNFGLQKQPERQSEAMDGALDQSRREMGEGMLDRERLVARVNEIVALQQELNHANAIARAKGLDAESVALLSQLIEQNPGDGGEKAVNTVLAYARACAIALDDVPEMAAALTAPPASVLPVVARGADEKRTTGDWRKAVFKDAAVGLVIGVVVIWMLV